MADPRRTIKKAQPGIHATQVLVGVVITIFATILLKAYIKSDASPFPSHWADMA